ncbi:MAG: DNA-3-methyladenine glycosylase [Anaerolineae bacterium]|nr:DNA-3-methyladenine glycosylase [Anaerolineae bacterium]
MERLPRAFFARPTLAVARDLLGQRLVRVLDGARISGRIVEAEAYVGEGDRACHARSGRTVRNAAMYGPPGHAYVYLIYGMHYCLNLVTEEEGFPAAVLIRALQPLEGRALMQAHRAGRPEREWANGPGKLCRALAIDRTFDKADLCAPDARLFVEADAAIPDGAVATGPRVGVTGDDAAVSAPWRFTVR